MLEYRERRRQTVLALGLARHPQPGYHGPRWTPEQLWLLGTDEDEVVAAEIGRTAGAVRVKRTQLNIPTARDKRRREAGRPARAAPEAAEAEGLTPPQEEPLPASGLPHARDFPGPDGGRGVTLPGAARDAGDGDRQQGDVSEIRAWGTLLSRPEGANSCTYGFAPKGQDSVEARYDWRAQ
jgi:hypothetical protein